MITSTIFTEHKTVLLYLLRMIERKKSNIQVVYIHYWYLPVVHLEFHDLMTPGIPKLGKAVQEDH